jgi:HEPN domain-containing protein
MSDDRAKTYREWARKAEEDELSIQAVLREGAPSTACFLAQQMAEKYLKGLLVFHGKRLPKVHDLLQLETLLLDIIPDIRSIHDDLDFLNRYYVETRYPGDYPEFTKEEGQRAYEAALRVKAFVMKKTA